MSYQVAIAEAAEAEAEAAYPWLLRRSPDTAARWYEGLLKAIASLGEFPTRCPLARENERFQQEIRQLLFGKGRSAYRILFTIIEADDPHEEPTVRVLHIRHGAQRELGAEDDSEGI